VSAGVLAPAGNALVVFGKTTPGWEKGLWKSGYGRPVHWMQVWVADGTSLKPLTLQELDNGAGNAATFSPDGTLLAIISGNRPEVWQVRPGGVNRLGTLPASKAEDVEVSADNRWLAVMSPGQTIVYDCDPVLPGGGGERFRQNLIWALFSFCIAAMALVIGLVVVRNLDIREVEACKLCNGTGICKQESKWDLGSGLCPSCHGWKKRKVQNSGGTGVPQAEIPLSRRVRWLRASAVAAGFGGLVCLFWWSWLTFFAGPTLQTPATSALAQTTATAITFSPDGRSLAAVFPSGDIAAFDTKTGAQTGKWSMPEKVTRVEYAPDGRHLLAIADRKAYVLRLQAFDEAAYMLACCEAELKDDPGSVDALVARGLAYRKQGDLPRAIEDFTEAIDRDGSNASPYYQRGLTRADSGDLAGARADLAKAVELDPLLDPDAKPVAAPKGNGK
jgi:hypothetical protein